ncbi:alpha/beta hydrolase [Kineococcus glutinatus]|uniref:Pimeloyl-ACP methyl ester carboxylesterase n=1 Tax=Kineococcus glutinatus TaxID=1070872 RepID=A0ABP9HQF6_9ACTN
MTVVFVHGAGRGGRGAWPAQQNLPGDPAAAVWLDWPDAEITGAASGGDLTRAQVDALLTCADEPLDVVAHSHGAVAALLAARRPDLVRSLVLFEPACFGLARGRAAVEEHIEVMDPVLSRATDPGLDDTGYARLFFTALGAPVPPADTPEQVLALRRLRTVRAPWTVPLEAAVLARTPTLVVTGGWLPLYEQTARALAAAGARHEVLPGHGHRPQDHPGAGDLVRVFQQTFAPAGQDTPTASAQAGRPAATGEGRNPFTTR